MFDIYIKNYTAANGIYQTAEQLLYSIPMDPEEPNAFIDPKVTGGMGKAGAFEFRMNAGHPYYDSLCQMKTIFRVVYDGDVIFRGRVLTIDTDHLTGIKGVHCEGDLAFFLDSQIEGVPDDKRTKTDALTYINQLISAHNSQMSIGMPDKQFLLGELPGQYSSAIETPQRLNPDNNYLYGSGSWRDTQSALNELSDSFGGFFRTRYQNGSVYVDWLDGYYRSAVNEQTIELGENLIDINSNSEVNNIFTALIPIGSKNGKAITIEGYRTDIHGNNNYILVPDLLKVYSDAELNVGVHTKEDYQKSKDTYDVIYHVEQFSNADTQEKLWNYALDWIKNNYIGGLDSFTITALDMHLVGGSTGKFLVGDRVNVIYPDVDLRSSDPEAIIQKLMTVMEATYELYHPEKNQYKIGIPNAILKKNYGTKKTKKSSSGGAGSNQQNENAKDIIEDSWTEYTKALVWKFVQDGATNSERYQEYRATHGEKASDAILESTYISLGQWLNTEDPELAKYGASIVLDGDKNLLAMKAKRFRSDEIDEYNATLTSIVLNSEEASIALKQKAETLPKDFTWSTDYIKDVFRVDALGGLAGTAANWVINTITGQSKDDPGTSVPSMIAEGGKSLLTTVSQFFAGNKNDVQAVANGDKQPNLSLEGLISTITGGNGEFNLFKIFGNGESGNSSGWSFSKLKESAQAGVQEAVNTIKGDGETGWLGMVKAWFGGSSNDGIEGLEEGTTEATVAIDGETGTQQVGKDDQGHWRVLVNDSVTYTDASGVVHTSEPGFVTANDFAAAGANEIPSFKTQVAVIKSLIADKAFIADLQAVNAKIDKIVGNTVVANTQVRAAHMQATELSAGQVVATGTIAGSTVVGNNLGFVDGEGSYTYLGLKNVKIGANFVDNLYLAGSSGGGATLTVPNAVTGFGTSREEGGKIYIPYYTYDSGATKAGDINFNIADTATYKAAVGIKSTGSWVWNYDEGNYIRTVQANNNTSEPIYLPMINATAGTPSGGKVRVNVTGPEGHVITYEDVTITGGNIKALETVNASTSSQTILPPSGYDGFAKIIVNAAPLRNYTGDSKITSNGTYTAGSSYYGIGTVVVDTPTAGGISSVALNGPNSSAYSGEDKGTLERNKYYQVVATPNSGEAVSIRFKTAASSASATFTSVSSLPSGKTATNLRKGYLYKFTFIRDGTTVTANYYKCPA